MSSRLPHRTRRFLHRILNRITLTAVVLTVELIWMLWMVFRLSQYALWINTLFSLITLGIVLHIIRRDEHPSYKIGWILLTSAVPLFGWLLYALFGNKRLSRRMKRKIQAVEQQHADALKQPDVLQEEQPLPERFLATSHYVHEHGGYPAYAGTDVQYFAVGDDLFPVLLADLESARHYIFMEYFILANGEMLDRIFDVLRRKAAEGVDVRVIYDDVGCEAAALHRFAPTAEHDGIRCMAFNPIIPVLSLVMNHRDHRKFTVVDGRVACTGGINIADEYINRKKRFGHWKDTGLRLCGDAAWSFTVMFLNLWNAFRPTDDDYSVFRPRAPLPLPSDGAPRLIQPFSDSPLDNEHVGESVYLEILAQAQRYVYIFTPYLIIDNDMQNALCLAAKRGVDVRIVTPGIPDKKTAFRLTRSYYPALLSAGVRIYEYTPGFLHAKSFVCDDSVAVVGTINMDFRSLYLHFECATLLWGGDAVRDLRDDCLATMRVSREVHPKDMRRPRHLLQQLIDAVLRALSPLF